MRPDGDQMVDDVVEGDDSELGACRVVAVLSDQVEGILCQLPANDEGGKMSCGVGTVTDVRRNGYETFLYY